MLIVEVSVVDATYEQDEEEKEEEKEEEEEEAVVFFADMAIVATHCKHQT